jgi:thiol:disulfide interchange protein DsbD
MHTIKVCLGFVELAAALKFFSNADLMWTLRLLPREPFLALWAALFAAMALYVLKVIRWGDEPPGRPGPLRLAVGVVLLVLPLYFGRGALGHRLDWVTEALAPPYSLGNETRSDRRNIVKDDLDGGLELARKAGKKVFLNFTGVT